MIVLQILFWFLLLVVVYAYIGYGAVLYFLIQLKRFFLKNEERTRPGDFQPEVTFLVAAWNEEEYIRSKIKNSLQFDYPKDKIVYYFVTDGSSDRTPQLIGQYPYPDGVRFRLFHKDERRGKIAAVERVMPFVKTPLVIYSDANTDVNPQAIKNIVKHYEDDKTGAVAGEKRIAMAEKDSAAATEGFYWKYESALKKWDAELYSVVGAAGELFSIRTELFEAVPPDTLVEDFYLTMRIAQRGYTVGYAPDAYAVETSSASIAEELKRKIRIAAGGLQAVYRLAPLLNIFKYGILSFQYISHRVLRWTVAPVALPLLFIFNIILTIELGGVYAILLIGQCVFYLFALVGFFLEKAEIKFKAFFIPFYFCMMNYAMYRGLWRLVSGRQSVLWEKAKRA